MRSLKDNPNLECDWTVLMPFINSNSERTRAISINNNIRVAPYPLTSTYLNNYFDNNKFNLANFNQTFYRDCAASMYSYFLMTFGYSAGTGGNNPSLPVPARPGGGGVSFGVNPFFGLFDIDSPLLWLLMAIAAGVIVKKITD